MILHRSQEEVRRFNWFKWIVLLILLIILIIMLLTGRAFDRTADSGTGTDDTTAQVEGTSSELTAPTFDAPDGDLTSGEVTLSGTGTPGSDVEVVVDGEVIGKAKVGADGKWSLKTDLEAGNYQLGARTLDADGNIVAEADAISLSVGEALGPPTINLPDGELEPGTVSLSGTGTPGSTVDIVLDGEVVGTTVVGDDGTWSYDLDVPEGGDYELGARTLDADGNVVAEADPMTLELPKLSELALPSINWPDIDFPGGLFTLTGTGRPGDVVEVIVDGEVKGTTTVGEDGTWAFDLDLPQGDYELATRAYDVDGNLLAETDAATMTVSAPDIDAPVIEIPDGGFSAGKFALSGTGTPGTDIEVVVNGEVIGKTKVGDDGTWSFDLELPEGEYEVVVQAVDANGQVITSSDSSLISLNPPAAALEITEPADGTTLQSGELTLTGVGAPGAEIEILDNGVVIGTAVVGDDGTWTFAFEPEPGNHEYGVRNVGDESVAGSVMTTIEAPVTDTSAVGVCDDPEPGIDQGTTYIVAQCEWLIRIANRLGIEYDALIGVNPQIEDPNIIFPGQVINLPPR